MWKILYKSWENASITNNLADDKTATAQNVDAAASDDVTEIGPTPAGVSAIYFREVVSTDGYGLYLDRTSGDKAADTIIEVIQNTGAEIQDHKGNRIATGDYYVEVNGIVEKVMSTNSVQSDEYGYFYIEIIHQFLPAYNIQLQIIPVF